jgi:hypothetical protein
MVGYGLGWNIGVLNGRDTLLTHGGGLPGFAASVSLMPESDRYGRRSVPRRGQLVPASLLPVTSAG